LLLIACFLAAGLAQAEEPPAPDPYVPFLSARGKIVIPVSAGGHGPYSFLLDLGVERPILDLVTLSELGLSAKEGDAASLTSLEVGLFAVPQAVVEAADLSHLRTVLGEPMAGILPARFAGACVAIDFSRGRLAYLPPDALPDLRRYSRTAVLRPEKDGPQVMLTVNGGKPFAARVDLSYAGALAVPKSLAQSLGLLDIDVPRVQFQAAEGTPAPDGRMQVYSESVNLAGAELRHAFCTVRDTGDIAILGTGFLKHSDVIFDFAENRLLLAPLDSDSTDAKEAAYGVLLGDFKDGYWALLVAVNSPAYRAGIKPGDRLKSVDDEDMLNLPYDEAARRIAGNAGRSAKLTVLRGEETKEFTVKAEPLIRQ
jgi:hypothetical protein